jgi:hypothetical protein
MMDLTPERIGNAVVFNAVHACPKNEAECGLCFDYAVAIHNWLLAHNLKYVILDLQDEKEVCQDFLVELLQLRKRLRYPFLFCGAMEKPRKLLEAYDYGSLFPFFVSPEEAVDALGKKFPQLVSTPIDHVTFGHPIPVARPRQGQRFDPNSSSEPKAADEAEADE